MSASVFHWRGAPEVDLNGLDPAAIRSGLPSAAEIAAWTSRAMDGDAPDHLLETLSALGVATEAFAATVASSRVGAVGVAVGCRFAHHELRVPLPMPADARPEIDVWGGARESEASVWIDGVLETPKYFSFFLEDRMPPHNPNHRQQWRPHELLHRVVGFGWHPQVTGFEAYVCARLAELLPVVHWYGFDEIGRQRCEAHQGTQLYDQFCAACEAAASTPFWARPPDAATRLEAQAEAALVHLEQELGACVREIETGRRHRVARPRLDASSDAAGYLSAHWPRLTSWSFGAWVEMFLTPGVDFQTSAVDLARQVARVAARIVGGPVEVDLEGASRARARRAAQDVAGRVMLLVDHLDEDRWDRVVMPPLEALAEVVRSPASASTQVAELERALAHLVRGLEEISPTLPVAEVVALGYPALGLRADGARAIEQVCEGLESGLPDWLARTSSEQRMEAARRAVADDGFWGTGELRVRAQLDEPGRLEAWLRARPHRDEDAELFSTLPDDLESLAEGQLRLVDTWRRTRASGGAVAMLFDWPVADRAHVELGALWFGGEPRAFELDDAHVDVVAALEAGRRPPPSEALMDLVRRGALSWVPPIDKAL